MDWDHKLDEIERELSEPPKHQRGTSEIDVLTSIRDALWVIAKRVNPEGVVEYDAGVDWKLPHP